MLISIPKESKSGENRVAMTPAIVKKLIKKGLQVQVQSDAGKNAGFLNEEYIKEGAQIVDEATSLSADIVLKVIKPTINEIQKMKSGSIVMGFLEPYSHDGTFEKLAQSKIDGFSMELIPRTSRAQSMDALSSQANIAGYRAVIEACRNYQRFFPMMMTSAGLSKPAKFVVLGAGVAGLQAIATAKRLGASVEAFDVRSEVKEQILSLGAKFLDLDLGEEGAGEKGYAKELSEDAKIRQQKALTERLKKFDIVVSTANIPGKKAPVLITEEAVRGMRCGSVIVDMAAATGGNCPLTEPDQIVEKMGVKIVGLTNYPSLMSSDASQFYGQNLFSLLSLIVPEKELKINFDDDIVAASMVTHQGSLRVKRS